MKVWSYLLKKVLPFGVEWWESLRKLKLCLLLLLNLLKNLLVLLVRCRFFFLQWKSIMIKNSHKRRRNIIHTFKKQIISRNENEKGVKNVYYITRHVHVMYVFFPLKMVKFSLFSYKATFHPSTLGFMKWLYLEVDLLLVKEKCKAYI
jgi:hypothetical protein